MHLSRSSHQFLPSYLIVVIYQCFITSHTIKNNWWACHCCCCCQNFDHCSLLSHFFTLGKWAQKIESSAVWMHVAYQLIWHTLFFNESNHWLEHATKFIKSYNIIMSNSHMNFYFIPLKYELHFHYILNWLLVESRILCYQYPHHFSHHSVHINQSCICKWLFTYYIYCLNVGFYT